MFLRNSKYFTALLLLFWIINLAGAGFCLANTRYCCHDDSNCLMDSIKASPAVSQSKTMDVAPFEPSCDQHSIKQTSSSEIYGYTIDRQLPDYLAQHKKLHPNNAPPLS
jgi:hypothetical protein